MKKLFLSVLMLVFAFQVFAQDQEAAIDASKPTNFYTLLDNQLEYNAGSQQVGYRASIMYSPREKHLLMGELPILHNLNSKFTGLGDIRMRYFYLPHKDYSKVLGAFGPSIDVYAPTGDFNKGLGSGRWIVAPGITAGILVTDWISFFPVLSYMYQSQRMVATDPESVKKFGDPREMHGMSFQLITPIVFSERFFSMITPVIQMPDFRNGQTNLACEFMAQYALTPKAQISGFYKTDQRMGNIFRLGMTFYL
ncbi:hypothetical protein [Persicobacter diffluens]|uniref:Transporter n=1 Tax=Persicobacter diffluens TaxID=981 RepID=A0AAN4W3I3_9BACT|nr:hypothetical protein PEDI_38720 [Persicobacter diffluens]